LDRITGLLCVIFFVIHGVELDVEKFLTIGVVGGGYIVLRTAGKYLGIYFAAGVDHENPDIRRWLGATMFSQAGAAIALAAIAADSVHGLGEMGKEIQTIILGSVVFFEIVGPISLRLALLRTGEVPLSQAIDHRANTPWGELHALGNRLMVALGYKPWGGRPVEELTVEHVMRRNTKTIPATATFDDVAVFIEHSHDNTFAVTGPDGELVGVIRYSQLRTVLFDAHLGSLVCASDLAVPCSLILYPDDPITRTQEHFRRGSEDDLPVAADEESKRFVGLVRRRDLFRLFSRSRRDPGHSQSAPPQ
jgi:CBS domain-containing protein